MHVSDNVIFLVIFSADSPVLWLRIDPDMNLLSHVTWEQPDFMWQYQLKFERDVVAQKEVCTIVWLTALGSVYSTTLII